MFECKICGFKTDSKAYGAHLKSKHNITKIEYLVNYRGDLDYTRKEILENKYNNEKMSIKQITEFFEKKYDVSSLKDTILKLFKYYDIKLRSVSESQKLFINRSGGVWNKGKTKKSSEFVKKYADKKKELYADFHNVLYSMELSKLIETFGVGKSLRIIKIVRERIGKEKQEGKCLLCGKELDFYSGGKVHIHHIDRQHSNDSEENLCVLCINCHMILNGHKHRLNDLNKYNTFSLIKENIDDVLDILNKSVKKSKRCAKEYENKIEKEECFLCNKKDTFFHIHHIDSNTKNNSADNLCCLCHSCHSKITGRAIVAKNKEDMKEKFLNFKCYEGLEWSKTKINISNIPLKEFIKLNS